MSINSASSSSSSSSQGNQNAQAQIKVVAGETFTITKKRFARFDKTIPGQMVRFEAGSRQVAEVAARVFEDREIGMLYEHLAETEVDGTNSEPTYIAVYIPEVSDSRKRKYYLMLAEDVKQALGGLPEKKDAHYVVPAYELYNFIVQRDKEVMQEAALAKKINEMKVSTPPTERSVTMDTLFDPSSGIGRHRQLQFRAMVRTMTAQGINDADANKIASYVINNIFTLKYQQTEEYQKFQEMPGAMQSEGFRIDKRQSRLKYSINVGKDGSVELMLKSKNDHVSKDDRMNVRGGEKTVKTALNLMTGQIKVQVTIDISASAREIAARNPNWNNMNSVDQGQLIDKIAMERVASVKKNDYDLPNELCDLKASNFIVHRSHQTPSYIVDDRREARKPIRKEGDIVVSYTMVKADGDLANVALVEQIRGKQKDGVHVSALFKNAIISLLQQVKKLHERPQPVVHRDIKVSNIFVLKNEPYLMDLGFASEVNAQGTADGSIKGTFYTLAPDLALLSFEQSLGHLRLELAALKHQHKQIDLEAFVAECNRVVGREAEIIQQVEKIDLRKGDLYSLGATIFEMALRCKGGKQDSALTSFGREAQEIYREFKVATSEAKQFGGDVVIIKHLEAKISDLEKKIKELEKNHEQFCQDDKERLEAADAPPELQELCFNLMDPKGKGIDNAIIIAESLEVF